ncbi:MAG TPA: SMP-30/gluconolactonase/LRE family protein [Puia sp.]|nr:SMP-30/gluconolactonase/LRE family protein [Puia sp.]
MKNMLLAIACLSLLATIGCNTPEQKPATATDTLVGRIELYDPSAARLIDSNAKVEVIGRNYKWSEGPVWIPSRQMLLFSDVLRNTVFQWKEGKDTPIAYLTPSGYTDTAARNGENGSNGLTLDKDGKLLLCQSGNRQVVRMNASLDSPKPTFTVLSANYKGKKFNSPNDIVADHKGNIYFTDPIYGLPKHENDPTRELTFEGVYRITPKGETILLIDSIPRPNGIALSPDEKVLYVGSSDDPHTKWYAYHLDTTGNIISGNVNTGSTTPGNVSNGTPGGIPGSSLTGGNVLLDGTALKAKATVKQGADGFKVDKEGNIFSSGPDGINILSPQGKILGLIKVYGRPVSNCAFNETKDVLYITADDLVLRVRLH